MFAREAPTKERVGLKPLRAINHTTKNTKITNAGLIFLDLSLFV